MSKKYRDSSYKSIYLSCGEKLLESYKDKRGVFILYYIDLDGNYVLDVDYYYRRKPRLTKNKEKWLRDMGMLDLASMFYTGGVSMFSDAITYSDILWGLRFNKQARRWFKKRAHEMVLKSGNKITDFLLPSGRLDWKKLNSL